jgi:hypothetical protein
MDVRLEIAVSDESESVDPLQAALEAVVLEASGSGGEPRATATATATD